MKEKKHRFEITHLYSVEHGDKDKLHFSDITGLVAMVTKAMLDSSRILTKHAFFHNIHDSLVHCHLILLPT